MRLFILISLLLLICLEVLGHPDLEYQSSTVQANWETFIHLNYIPTSESFEVIKSLDVKRYFDTSKGLYRIGLLAEDILSTFNDYVTLVDKPIPVTHVDYPNLLMHMVGAINHLYQEYHTFLSEISLNHTDYKSFIVNELRNLEHIVSSPKYQSIASIRYQNRILEQKLNNIAMNKSLIVNNSQRIRSSFTNQLTQYMRTSNDYEQRYFDMLDSFYLNKSIDIDYYNELLNIEANYTRSELSEELHHIEQEYLLELKMLEIDNHVWANTLSYRLTEESRIAKETESHRNKILSTQNALYIQSMNTIVQEVFRELTMLITNESSLSYEHLLFLGGLSVVCLFCVVLLLEVIRQLYTSYYDSSIIHKISVSSHIVSYWTRYRRTVVTFEGLLPAISDEQPQTINALRFNDSYTSQVFVSQLQTLQSVSAILQSFRNKSIRLQHVLIHGRPGTGKSYLSQRLADASGLSYCVIRCSDLLAMDMHLSGLYLKRSIEYMQRRASIMNPALMILDNVDCFLEARASSDLNSTVDAEYIKKRAHDCFYVLLDAMKEQASCLSFILLSQSTHLASDVDSAILDRLDKIVELPVATIKESLDFLILKGNEMLDKVMSPSSKIALTRLIDCSGHGDYALLLGETLNFENQSAAKAFEFFNSARCIKSLAKLSDYKPRDSVQDAMESHDFDVVRCLAIAAAVMQNHSYRDLMKFLLNVRAESLSSSR